LDNVNDKIAAEENVYEDSQMDSTQQAGYTVVGFPRIKNVS
jgi:hypothetical protein